MKIIQNWTRSYYPNYFVRVSFPPLVQTWKNIWVEATKNFDFNKRYVELQLFLGIASLWSFLSQINEILEVLKRLMPCNGLKHNTKSNQKLDSAVNTASICQQKCHTNHWMEQKLVLNPIYSAFQQIVYGVICCLSHPNHIKCSISEISWKQVYGCSPFIHDAIKRSALFSIVRSWCAHIHTKSIMPL